MREKLLWGTVNISPNEKASWLLDDEAPKTEMGACAHIPTLQLIFLSSHFIIVNHPQSKLVPESELVK
jgi:hypothetical protein